MELCDNIESDLLDDDDDDDVDDADNDGNYDGEHHTTDVSICSIAMLILISQSCQGFQHQNFVILSKLGDVNLQNTFQCK